MICKPEMSSGSVTLGEGINTPNHLS